MVTAPLRCCPVPGCPEKVAGSGRCPQHQREKHRAHSSTLDPRYRSRRWTEYSRRRRGLFPRCAVCGSLDAAVTDHIQPVKAHPELFWEPTNHRTLCRSCNRKATDAELETVYPEGKDDGPALA